MCTMLRLQSFLSLVLHPSRLFSGVPAPAFSSLAISVRGPLGRALLTCEAVLGLADWREDVV